MDVMCSPCSGVDSMSHYEQAIRQVRYRNWHPTALLERRFRLSCSELNGRYTSNEFNLEVRALPSPPFPFSSLCAWSQPCLIPPLSFFLSFSIFHSCLLFFHLINDVLFSKCFVSLLIFFFVYLFLCLVSLYMIWQYVIVTGISFIFLDGSADQPPPHHPSHPFISVNTVLILMLMKSEHVYLFRLKRDLSCPQVGVVHSSVVVEHVNHMAAQPQYMRPVHHPIMVHTVSSNHISGEREWNVWE